MEEDYSHNQLRELIKILEYPNTFIQVAKVKTNAVNSVSLVLTGTDDIELLKEFIKKFYKTYNMHWLGNVSTIKESRANSKDILVKTYTYFDIDGLSEFMEYDQIVYFAEALKFHLNESLFGSFSAIVVSGGGVHIYYKLLKPFSVNEYTKEIYQQEYEIYAKKLQEFIETRMGITGFKIDLTCKDIAKNVRLPFSFNHKRKKPTKVIWAKALNSGMFSDIEMRSEKFRLKGEEKKKRNEMISKFKKRFFFDSYATKETALNYPIRELCERYGMSFKKDFCRSPFNRDTNASFKIYEKTNTWYCFSTAQGGDTINLIAKLENLDVKKDFKKILSIINNI